MSDLSPSQLRRLFPALTTPGFLNAAAASPLAQPVEEAAVEHFREMAKQADVGVGTWLMERERVREQLARFIRASPKEVAFVPSTSFGVHVAGQVLWQLGVREVLTLEQEFPTTTLPLLNLGFRLRLVRPRPDGSYPVEDLEAAVGSETRAFIASAVQYSTGVRLDVAGAAAMCRAKNLFFALNVVQALGQVPVDVSAGVDLLFGTSHKWLMAGFGGAFFSARDALFGSVQLPMAGWLSVESPAAMDNLVGARVEGRTPQARSFTAEGARFRSEVSALEMGAGSHAPIRCLGAALTLIDRVGVDVIDAHNFRLQQRLRESLRARGFRPNAECAPGQGSGICVFPVQGDSRAVAHSLLAHGVVTSPRAGGLRVATHVFNDEEDLARLFHAFDALGVRPG